MANTGTPLDTAGVAALASLRASAKRDNLGSVGRFGVGFAAVLAVSDAPRVISLDGSVAFSATRTARAVAALPGPAAELARRDEPPVLRLVWPAAEVSGPEEVPAGFATEVRLPLRAGVDPEALLAHARDTAPDLLLALPGLVEISVGVPTGTTVDAAGSDVTVATRVDGPGPGEVTIMSSRWLLARRGGTLEVTDQAVEQRERRDWSVTWALPLAPDGTPAPLSTDVVHAPTPTEERLALPARLLATLPLEPDRRRVRPGPATDDVLAGAAAAYLDLVHSVEPGHRLALVPEAGFPRSALDERLRDLLLDALRAATWLPAADGGELAPGRAEWLDLPGADPRLLTLLAAAGFDRLLATTTAPPAALGVARVGAAELVSRLFGVERPAPWWREVYAELAPVADTVPGLRDDLRALPVPLADGRRAAGPATVLLPEDSTSAAPAGAPRTVQDPSGSMVGPVSGQSAVAALGLPGLYIADPAAVHPLLARLGAGPADPSTLLEHPALAEAVARSVEDADAGLDPAPLAEAVLALVVERGVLRGAPPALAALALLDSDGRPARADELVLPDAVLRPLLADDAPLDVLDAGWAARIPRAALVAIGVVDGFALVVDEDPVAPEHDLDDEERWWDGLDTPPRRLVAVRDLDLVATDAWPAALALLASDRETRAAVTASGSYTAWWLARHARLGGHRPAHWRLPGARFLVPLYDPAPVETGASGPSSATGPSNATGSAVVDEGMLRAIGVRGDLVVRDRAEADDLLARLADPGLHPDVLLVAEAHVALAEAVAAGRVDAADLDLPEHVRTLDGGVASVEVAAVLDAPWPAAVLPAAELVIGGDPYALAELLDLPLATDVVAGDVEGDGEPAAWAAIAEVVVACHTLGVPVPAGGLRVHKELWVAVRRPRSGRHRVPTWVDSAGVWHAEDPLRALLGVLAQDEAAPEVVG
ncbi:MAG: ATP-binding protein [Pseudonocardia sp.]|nr:ATP-binding protein [Pseudonocardia sp.]